MTTLNKILLIIIGVLVVSAGGFIIYQKYMFDKQAKQIEQSVIDMKQLKDDIIRSQSQYVNQKGFEDFVKQNQINLGAIQADLKTIGGQIVAINEVVAKSRGQVVVSGGTTTTEPNPNPPPKADCLDKSINCVNDKFNYFGTIQKLQLNEDFGKVQIPIGEVGFNAGTVDDKPWGYKIRPREYKIDNTIAHTGEGQTIVYNALTIKSGDDVYTVPISSSNTVEKFPASSFSWWNPRLALGLSGAASFTGPSVKFEATPSISVSIMSYGQTKANPDVRVLAIGLGYNVVDQRPALELSPIQFNVGKAISGTLLNNSYIGPVLGVNTAGSFQVGLGIQVGL
jgi:uncharacterized protein YxeA